ncbi:MAG: hypothetical protein AB2L09_07235 [Coriobacteriia bacterium]
MAAVVSCPLCGTMWELRDDENQKSPAVCPRCGTQAPVSTETDYVTCTQCGLPYEPEFDSCPHCSNRKRRRRRIALTALAIAVGAGACYLAWFLASLGR